MSKKIPKPPEPKFRPSALPMLAQCPKFEGAESEYTNEGTKRHNVLADYFRGNKEALKEVADHLKDDLQWAIDYIELKAPSEDDMAVEQQLEAVLPNGLKIRGTPDIGVGPEILDLKWRPRDYRAQMAAYAYMWLDNHEASDTVKTHLLFASNQTVRSYKWTMDSAWLCIQEIIINVESAWAAPTPCEYCGWCKHKLKCEALIQQVNIALQSNPEWNLPQWHSSEITTAQEMGMALRIARTLSDWCESVEYHAKELATKQGIVAEGFNLTSRKGNRVIADISAAFANSNLPQPEFLKACSVKFRALVETYAVFHGMKKAPAERDIEGRLGNVIQRKSPATMLVAERKPKKKD